MCICFSGMSDTSSLAVAGSAIGTGTTAAVGAFAGVAPMTRGSSSRGSSSCTVCMV